MSPTGSLLDHEWTFDDLVQSLSTIGKMIDSDELIVLYANSLPVEIFGNWIQSQMAFIDNITITEFKGRVREEGRLLNLAGLGQTLGVERDPDSIQLISLAQTASFPPENPTFFLNAVIVVSRITLRKTATNVLRKNTMLNRPTRTTKEAVAGGVEAVDVVETIHKLILLTLIPPVHLPTLQFSASRSVSKLH